MQRADFEGIFRVDGRPSGDDPHPRPAAARVPAAHRRGAGRGRGAARRAGREDRHRGRRPARDQPDARSPRLPSRRDLPRDHRDAGARDPRGRLHRQEGGCRRPPRDHDPARRRQEGAREPGAARARHCRGGVRRAGRRSRLPRRHHDRDPARGAHGRQDRRDGRVLQLRHQRPHADDVRHLARRRRQVPAGQYIDAGDLARRPVRDARPGGRRPAGRDGHRARSCDARRPQGGHLRRARRRSGDGQVLPPRRHELRQLFAVPRAGGASRRGAGGHRSERAS